MVTPDGVSLTAAAIARVLFATASGLDPDLRKRERHPDADSALAVLAPR